MSLFPFMASAVINIIESRRADPSNMSRLALVVSGISAVIAAIALGWNIYRDIILRPRVKVRLIIGRIRELGEGDDPNSPLKICFSATNHGPGIVVLSGLRGKNRRLFNKTKSLLLFNDPNDPLSHQFPKELKVAASADFFIPFIRETFFKNSFTHIGILDSFGRYHWVPKKDIKRARREYEKAFGRSNE